MQHRYTNKTMFSKTSYPHYFKSYITLKIGDFWEDTLYINRYIILSARNVAELTDSSVARDSDNLRQLLSRECVYICTAQRVRRVVNQTKVISVIHCLQIWGSYLHSHRVLLVELNW